MTSQLIYIVLAPKLGTTLRFSLVVTGQMAVLLILDYYGLLGLPVKSIDWQHLLGNALLITGVLLIRKF